MSVDHEARLFQILPSPQYPVSGITSQRRVIELDGDFERYGVWAGVGTLVEMAYHDLLRQQRHDILDEHNYALYMVLLDYRDVIKLKYACLTETARGSEKTRNFPLDRAYRIVHSLVTLISQWKATCAADEEWAVVVRHGDRAQHLATRFFRELARRLTERHRLAVYVSLPADRLPLLAAADDVVFAAVHEDTAAIGMESPQAAKPSSGMDAGTEESAGAMDPVAEQLQYDMNGWEKHYIPLLQKYIRRGDELSAALASIRTLCMYDHYGYYHEAASFADRVVPYLTELASGNEDTLWNYGANVVQSMISTGREERGLELLTQYLKPVLTDHTLIARMHYIFAMLHLRYLKHKDIALAEHHINTALAHLQLAKPNLAQHDFVFLNVFLNNGLAFVRVRQGRRNEAIELCQQGFATWTDAVGDEKHRLHRSVLLYNSAQVYVALGKNQEALKYYRDAIGMDPYYSEYYNEMGNILQQQGEFAEALSAYDLAIKYSAPYPEVYFNKGICHSQLEQWDDALACLAFSAELNPKQPELYLLSAEILEQLGRDSEAMASYTAAIGLANPPVMAHVNRAVLHYQAGNFTQALADMANAIAADPSNADHYENRAEIYRAMNQPALVDADMIVAQRYREAA
jgi:tetratricopeptide (TPR) repeat protein